MSRLTRWAEWDWVVALVLAPVLFAPALFPLGVILIAIAGAPLYLMWLLTRYPTARSPLNLPILLLLTAVLLSLYANIDLLIALPSLCGILLALVAVYTLLAHAEQVSPRKIAVAALLLGLLVALVTLARPEPSDKFALLSWITPRVPDAFAGTILALRQGQPLNGNVAAGMLVLLVPLNLIALRFLPRPIILSMANALPRTAISARVVRTGLLISFVLMLLALFAAQSRSAFLGIACAFLFLVWVRFPARRPRLAVGTLVVALLVGTALSQFGADPSGSARDDDLVGNFPAREEIWMRGVALVQDFPLTGVGLGGFPRVANALYPFFIHSVSTLPPHAHNLLLQAAVELGMIGLVAYLSLLAAFVACIRYVYAHAAGDHERRVALGIAAGMLAYQVYGLTDATGIGTRASLVFWLGVGAAGTLYARQRVTRTAFARPWRAWFDSRRALGVGALASSLIIAAMVGTIIEPDGWSCTLIVNASAIDTARALIPRGAATIRLPLASPLSSASQPQPTACAVPLDRLEGINLLAVQHDTSAAVARLNDALALNANDFAAQVWLARASEQRGETEAALALWLRVGNLRHLRELAIAAEGVGDLHRALAVWNLLGDTTRYQALALKSEREGKLDRAVTIWQWLGDTARLRTMADASEKSGQLDRAIRIWVMLGNVARLEALARRTEGTRDFEHAIKIWRALKNKTELARLARVSEQQGDFERARALWREVGDGEQIRTLAWSALQKEQLGFAAAVLDDLESLAPQDPRLDRLRLQLAEKYTAKGDYSRALAAFRRVLGRDPHNFQVEQRVLAVAWQSGAVQDTFTEVVGALCESATGDALWQTLHTFLTNSDHDARATLLQVSLAADCAPRTRGKILQLLAAQADKQNDFEVAIPIWQTLGDARALRQVLAGVKPDNAQLRKAALAALTYTLPRDSSNYVQLARLLLGEGNVAQAQGVLERAAAQRVDSPWLYLLLGDLYEKNGQRSREIQLYADALSDLSEPQPLYLPLGMALFREDQFAESTFYLKRAANPDDADPRAYYYLARALWNQGKRAEALQALGHALCLRPDNRQYRTLWQASVREAKKKGEQDSPADFDFAVCQTRSVTVH